MLGAKSVREEGWTCLAAGALAALVTGVVEGLLALLASPAPMALLAAPAFWAWAAPFLAGWAWIVGRTCPALLRVWPTTLAVVALTALGLGAMSVAVRIAAEGALARLTDLDLLVPVAALAAVGVASVAVLIGALAFRSLRAGLARLGRRRASLLVALLALAALLPTVGGDLGALLRGQSPRAYLLVVLALVVAPVALRWTHAGTLGRSADASPRRQSPTELALRWGAVWMLGLAVALALAAPWLWAASPAARVALTEARGVVSLTVGALQRATDGDRDGYSAWLAGGDCDDDDATRHPAALDLPGNGIDEDCRDGDRGELQVAEPAPMRFHAPASDARWNLLLVTIEAVRADRTSLHGHHRDTTPNLAELAKQGLVFERAYSTSNATRPVLPALLAGTPLHALRLDRHQRYLHLLEPTLFGRLKAKGWRTEAHLPALIRWGMGFGIERDFDVYEGHDAAELKGRSVPTLAPAAIESFGAEPFAVWVHLAEPHEPYLTHEAHDFGRGELDRYDAEIAAADAGLGRLVAALRERGLAERTLVAVTADHGEAFGEHGEWFHGRGLYDEEVRVPLVIHVPGADAARVAHPVSLVDLAPTLADLMGLKPWQSEAASHAGALFGAPAEPRPIHLEAIDPSGQRRRSVARVDWPLKAIIDLEARREMLFDLRADPAEKRDLASPDAPLLVTLREEMARRALAYRGTLLELHRSDAVPSGFDESEEVVGGLLWRGSELEERRIGERSVLQLRTVFEAVGEVGDDVTFVLVNRDDRGRVLETHRWRPLAGLYPTPQWRVGDVVTELAFLRDDPAWLGHTMHVELSAEVRGDTVFGPREVASFMLKHR